MAVEIDTASDYLDLLARVEAFAVLQGWTVHRSTYDELTDTDGELILGAPGLSADKDIICAIKSTHDNPTDKFNWEIKGARQFNGEAWASLSEQSTSRWFPLWNNAIPYWLVCNGQRLALVAKVSTVYMHLYMGFINSYATDAEYDYPLLIAGSATSNVRWSDQTSAMHAWWAAYDSTKSADLWMPNGAWSTVFTTTVSIWPYMDTDDNIRVAIQPTNNNYPLFPIVLYRYGSSPKGVFGEIDGLCYTPGAGAGTEDTIQVGLTDYLVAQETFRNTADSYIAMELA